jgi:hypothetical protein
LKIPEIPRMINCEGRQAPNTMQRNLRSTAMIYETTTLMPVLCPPVSLTDEVRSHSKLKAAGTVCYSEVTYHSNSRYKKGQKYGMKMARGRSGVDASPASNKKGNEVLLYKMQKMRFLSPEAPSMDPIVRYSNWKGQLRGQVFLSTLHQASE